jgi:glycosyltransferase involved in cell wall biosynthesis
VQLRVLFVLGRASPTPIGELKMVYRHADGLAGRGHEVTVAHPRRPVRHPDGPRPRTVTPSTPEGSDPHPWYRPDPRVRSLLLPDLAAHRIDGVYDVIVGANWQVVPQVETYPARFGRKVLFLSDYESARRPDGMAYAPMADGLRKGWPVIAGSAPVQRLVAEMTGSSCPLVAPVVDGSSFAVDVPIDDASRDGVGFPARLEWSKRTADAVAALEILRSARGSGLKAWCFGRYTSAALPDWIEHHPAPSDAELRRLYNTSAVFLVPSVYEGFGMPGAEAMACGAGLVSVRNEGVDAYAVHGESALLCPAHDPPALAAAVARLLDESALRRRLAFSGARTVTVRTWQDATDEFEACLSQFGPLPPDGPVL